MPTEVSAKALEQKLCVLTLVCTLDMPTEATLLCRHGPYVQKEQFPPFLVHHFYCSGYRGSKNKSKTNNSKTNQNKQTTTTKKTSKGTTLLLYCTFRTLWPHCCPNNEQTH